MQYNQRSTSRDDACCKHYPLRPIIGSGWKGNGRIERIQGNLFSWNLKMLLTPPCYAGNHASNLLHEPEDQYPAWKGTLRTTCSTENSMTTPMAVQKSVGTFISTPQSPWSLLRLCTHRSLNVPNAIRTILIMLSANLVLPALLHRFPYFLRIFSAVIFV